MTRSTLYWSCLNVRLIANQPEDNQNYYNHAIPYVDELL